MTACWKAWSARSKSTAGRLLSPATSLTLTTTSRAWARCWTATRISADFAARMSEISTIPRFADQFFQQYQDRLLFGTDFSYTPGELRSTFRTLETLDEHYYYEDYSDYLWPLYAWVYPMQCLRRFTARTLSGYLQGCATAQFKLRRWSDIDGILRCQQRMASSRSHPLRAEMGDRRISTYVPSR